MGEVDLGKSLPRVKASVRKVLSRLWSAKELQMGLGMLSRTLEGPEKRTPLGSCTAKSVLVDTPELCHQRGACSWSLFKPKNSDQSEGGKCVDRYVFGAASKMDTLMSVEPGPAVDWYGRVLADVRARYEIIEGVGNASQFKDQIRTLYSMPRPPALSRLSAHEWCPRACATVLESFPPLDDDGKEDFEAAIKNPSAFEHDLKEAGAGQPMSAHSQRRAIRALQNFLAPVAPKNAPAEKSTLARKTLLIHAEGT